MVRHAHHPEPGRRKEYSFEIRDQAEDLYIRDGLTFEEVAGRTGVSLPSVKAWAKKGGWRELRKKHIESRRTLRRSLQNLRETMLNDAIGNIDPQKVHAIIALEKLIQQFETKPEGKALDIDRPKIFLEDMEFVARTLQEIDPEGLKVFARNFETIVERFKESAQGG